MSENENQIQLNDNELEISDTDIDKLEESLNNKVAELEFLENEKKKIKNPDALGEVIFGEICTQFGNQVGLDMTNETLIQKYDREHPESYDIIKDEVMKDKKYKDANKDMRNKQDNGELVDTYTGKKIGAKDKANLDHVVSRKELYENQRRKQANLEVKDLANKDENLKATNESLNKSKKDLSVKEYVDKADVREKKLREQNKRANEKIDNSNLSETEKRLVKEKIDKHMQDKVDADEEKMTNADKEARKAINYDINSGVVKNVAGKAVSDGLKFMVTTAIIGLLREVVNGLIRFFKSATKSFKGFLIEMKEAIHRFVKKLLSLFKSGVGVAVGTIVSEIFGPIVSTFKRLASFIKQGAITFVKAIDFLMDKKNKDAPFSVKVAKVGEIVVAGMVGAGAIVLGGVFENFLITVPGFQLSFPGLGTLANIVGLFLSSMVSGVIGAIVINMIEKFIANKSIKDIEENEFNKNNEIIALQDNVLVAYDSKLNKTKMDLNNSIKNRHISSAKQLRNDACEIYDDLKKSNDNYDEIDKILNS